MTELVLGFKMFEKAPYDKPDSKALTEAILDGVREEERIYGPYFVSTLIKYALKAVSKVSGEQQPGDIKTIDQLQEYLFSKSDSLPVPLHFLVLWAQFVTDKKFEGSLAVGTQLMYKGFIKKAAKQEEDLSKRKCSIDEIIVKLRERAVEFKVAPLEFGYRKNSDETIDMYHGNCFYFDGCKLSLEQGILTRPDGRMVCGASVFVCQFLKLGTNCEWDYTVLEFSKQRCIVRCFMI
ncbi:MAG: hypothetical protein QXO71_00660 [Candidatus Jordarchaeaceae archaeon]